MKKDGKYLPAKGFVTFEYEKLEGVYRMAESASGDTSYQDFIRLTQPPIMIMVNLFHQN